MGLFPCKYCGAWPKSGGHAPSDCPDRAFFIIGAAVKEALEVDPSKTPEDIVAAAKVWAAVEEVMPLTHSDFRVDL